MLRDARFMPHLPCTDLARAKAFYVERLGLRVQDDQGEHMTLDANGVPLLVYVRGEPSKAEHTAAGWVVDDLVATVKALGERGVTFERYPGFEQDALGIARDPDGRGPAVAWFQDPDQNILSLMELPAQ